MQCPPSTTRSSSGAGQDWWAMTRCQWSTSYRYAYQYFQESKAPAYRQYPRAVNTEATARAWEQHRSSGESTTHENVKTGEGHGDRESQAKEQEQDQYKARTRDHQPATSRNPGPCREDRPDRQQWTATTNYERHPGQRCQNQWEPSNNSSSAT